MTDDELDGLVAQLRATGYHQTQRAEAADAITSLRARIAEAEALLEAYRTQDVPNLTAVYMAGGFDWRARAEKAEAALAEREAQVVRLLEMQDEQDRKLKDVEAERDEARTVQGALWDRVENLLLEGSVWSAPNVPISDEWRRGVSDARKSLLRPMRDLFFPWQPEGDGETA